MSMILSRRVAAVSKLPPNPCHTAFAEPLARANGLTVDEALELATWLREAGYDSIEVVHERDHACVVWHRKS